MSSKNRARVIYQSEALYVGTVDATGYHFSTSTDWDTRAGYKTHATYQDAVDESQEIRTGIQQLHRIQSANYSFSVNRQDVNQFGQLGRIDAVAIDPPTVTLDFSYYVTNGLNERLLGMNVSGDKSALASEIVDGLVCGDSVSQDGKNFFILTTCEGQDAVNNKDGESSKSVIALGNGYVSNYSVEAAVGGMPTANVTVDGLNLRAYQGTTGLASPAINTNFGTPVDNVEFNVPPAVSGVLNDSDQSSIDSDDSHGWSCLRPGDITMSLGTDGSAAEFNLLPSAEAPSDFTAGSAHVQSFSIDVPLSRSVLNRLGSPYGYARVVDYPVNVNVSVSAIVSDLKAGKLDELLWETEEHDLVFTLREPEPYGTGRRAIEYRVKGALLEGESFSSSIGDNKTVDLTFTAQIGGPQDLARGLMISGSRNALNIDKYLA